VDLIVQNVGHGGKANLTFTVPKADLPKALEIVKRCAGELGADSVETDDRIAKVSVVGVGMRNHAGVAAKAFEVLGAEGINIEMISTSEIKVSVVIAEEAMERAIRALHRAFGLDAPPAR
jgi:aspartate kinase